MIFTNQNGITTGSAQASDIRTKIEAIAKAVGVPFTALIASNDDQYRKPNVGMWKHFTLVLNEGKEVDLE